MAWNEPGGNKPKDPWGGGGDQGPPDLDEALKNPIFPPQTSPQLLSLGGMSKLSRENKKSVLMTELRNKKEREL